MSETVAAPKPPSRAQCDAIIRRYLKVDQNIEWGREMPTFYRVYKQYPSVPFWTNHQLPFRLNHMTWFESVEGKSTLAHDWAVFHYVPPPLTEPPQEEYSGGDASCDTVPSAPVLPPRRAKTVAEMLRG